MPAAQHHWMGNNLPTFVVSKSGCWVWTRATDKKGYALMANTGPDWKRRQLATRRTCDKCVPTYPSRVHVREVLPRQTRRKVSHD